MVLYHILYFFASEICFIKFQENVEIHFQMNLFLLDVNH